MKWRVCGEGCELELIERFTDDMFGNIATGNREIDRYLERQTEYTITSSCTILTVCLIVVENYVMLLYTNLRMKNCQTLLSHCVLPSSVTVCFNQS